MPVGLQICISLLAGVIAQGGDGWPAFTYGVGRWPIEAGGNGRTYAVLLVEEPWSWHDARDVAQAAGGDLAPAATAAEFAFVVALAQTRPAFSCVGPWIGGFREAGSPGASWTWPDGSPVGEFAWQVGRPAQSVMLDSALYLVGEGAPEGTWSDALPGPDAGAQVLSAMVRWDAFIDCDADGSPDALEILADASLDADWDGQIDGCTPFLPEDINHDGHVDGLDLVALLSAWGSVDGSPTPADINQDGVVDGADFSQLFAAWTG